MKGIIIATICFFLLSCNSSKRAQRRVEKTTTTSQERLIDNKKESAIATIISRTTTEKKIDTTIRGSKKTVETKPILISDLKPGENKIPNTNIAIYDSLGNILKDAKQALTDLTIYLDTSTGTIKAKATVNEPDRHVKVEEKTTRDERKDESKSTTHQVEATRQEKTSQDIVEKTKVIERGPSVKGVAITIGIFGIIGFLIWLFWKVFASKTPIGLISKLKKFFK